MSCSTSGSMRSLSPAWRRARSRCSWSTPARSACSDAAASGSPDEDMRRHDLPPRANQRIKKPPDLDPEAWVSWLESCARSKRCSALRLLGLLLRSLLCDLLGG